MEEPSCWEEDQLVLASQQGDHKAFEELVRRYYDSIFRLMMGFVSQKEDAEDLTQETFLEAYRCLKNFKGRSKFYTWLYRIGTNLAINHLKRKRKNISLEDIVLPYSPTPHSPSPSLEQREFYNAFFVALEKLAPERRIVLILREFQNLSYEEIAEVLNIKIGTVMSRLARAREEMRRALVSFLEG